MQCSPTGSTARTRRPCGAIGSNPTRPPTARARSTMPAMPLPATGAWVAGPASDTSMINSSGRPVDQHLGRRRTGVPDHIGQRLLDDPERA